jgi:hypothetical protein
MLTTQAIAAIIQLIIAPVVMITACSIFVNGLLVRYGAINDRMRLMARERLDLCFGGATGAASVPASLVAERLAQIDYQLPLLVARHKQMHDSVLTVYLAVLLYVVDMFLIAVSVTAEQAWLSTLVLIVFLVGTAVFFVSVLLAVLEVRASHLTVSYEVARVAALEAVGLADAA